VIGILSGPDYTDFNGHSDSHGGEAEPDAPTDDQGHPCTVLNRITTIWDKYWLPDLEKLVRAGGDKASVIGRERIQGNW